MKKFQIRSKLDKKNLNFINIKSNRQQKKLGKQEKNSKRFDAGKVCTTTRLELRNKCLSDHSEKPQKPLKLKKVIFYKIQ